MSLKAIAFHESISADELAKLSESESNELFAAQTFAHCEKCRTLFGVFLQRTDDTQNSEYIAELERRISADCDKGKHPRLEIRLDL